MDQQICGEKRRRRQQAGFTIPGFAEHFNLPVGQVRRAVREGSIKTAIWAGIERITPAEAERVAALFGFKASDEPGS
jgi:hypothetical protein